MGRRLGSAPQLEIMLGGISVSVCHGDFCMCHTSSLRGAWPCGMVGAHRAPDPGVTKVSHATVPLSLWVLWPARAKGPTVFAMLHMLEGWLGPWSHQCATLKGPGPLREGGDRGWPWPPTRWLCSAPLPGPLRSPSST